MRAKYKASSACVITHLAPNDYPEGLFQAAGDISFAGPPDHITATSLSPFTLQEINLI